MRVLIAEDDTVSRLILHRTVEQRGRECLVAVDGADAWECFREHRPDVVISDWLMPNVDGLELCRRIRAHPAGDGYTYVMLLSVLSDRGHFLTGMQAGADDYLTKPIEPAELHVRLEAAARITALHRTLAAQKTTLQRLLAEQEALNATLAETAEARGRLVGVTLAAREMAHLLSNDLALAVGTIDLLRGRPGLPADLAELVEQAATGLGAADAHLREFQNVVRVETKDTPVGPALDLARSTGAPGRGR